MVAPFGNLIHTCWARSGSMFKNTYGWLSPEYHLMSWALSCLLSKKYNGRIDLYADSQSIETLIQDIKLPYCKVINIDDFVGTIDKEYWALVKLYTCSVQTAPFLHIDGDVFIWETLKKEIFQYGIVVQNPESSEKAQRLLFEKYLQSFSKMPVCLSRSLPDVGEIIGYNTGMLGGTNYSFFRDFFIEAQYIVSVFGEHNSNFEKANFNMFFEQHLCYRLACFQEYPIYSYVNAIIPDQGYTGFADFHLVPYIKRYLHLIGGYKQNVQACIGVANYLRHHFPEFYYRIISLFLEKGFQLLHNCYDAEPRLEEFKAMSLSCWSDKDKRNVGLSEFHQIKLKQVHVDEPLKLALVYCRDKVRKTIPGEQWLSNVSESYENMLKAIETRLKWPLVHKSFKALYERDYSQVRYQEIIQKSSNCRNSIFIRKSDWWTTIVSNFNWGDILADQYNNVLLEQLEQNFAVIHECYSPYLSFKVLDAFDLHLLNSIDEGRTLEELISKSSIFFDPMELSQNYTDFERLFFDRLSECLKAKLILISKL